MTETHEYGEIRSNPDGSFELVATNPDGHEVRIHLTREAAMSVVTFIRAKQRR